MFFKAPQEGASLVLTAENLHRENRDDSRRSGFPKERSSDGNGTCGLGLGPDRCLRDHVWLMHRSCDRCLASGSELGTTKGVQARMPYRQPRRLPCTDCLILCRPLGRHARMHACIGELQGSPTLLARLAALQGAALCACASSPRNGERASVGSSSIVAVSNPTRPKEGSALPQSSRPAIEDMPSNHTRLKSEGSPTPSATLIL